LIFSKQPQIDPQSALFIKCGSETSEQLGAPPIGEHELGDLREKFDQ